ncbi:MAG: hypothetical protein H6632_10615 [Anaerolineales bacterium]|nr:hypothetical protein [Anaerolineales bacterium]
MRKTSVGTCSRIR